MRGTVTCRHTVVYRVQADALISATKHGLYCVLGDPCPASEGIFAFLWQFPADLQRSAGCQQSIFFLQISEQIFSAECTIPSLYLREEPAPAAVAPTEKDGVKRQTGGVLAQPKAKRMKKYTDLRSPPRRFLQEMKDSIKCETACETAQDMFMC